ncbi:hypothetical protein JYK14_22330 [Siccirubricoccus sp. KC 17139]|uniref:Uncharacterized protein n=1 Tax=Siccirubricoccus soli TaxID=2899147 RepID=A0ABT1DAD5_9PROT|nr:hypothetical protein [Siccirubricoccus soli]MCO6418876.1 hypothetical protein [Siccirubricoccus soli]MCP2685011.1 hypothetical protein [Siccirubricoccus soli]
MRRWVMLLVLGLPLSATLDAGAQPRPGPPHEWSFGAWTGGIFPPGDGNDTPACFGSPVVIFTRDVVMRATPLDVAYRQRNIETVAGTPNGGLEFRFTPAPPVMSAIGPRPANDAGFGCEGGPNVLRVERRGPDEIVFPNCSEFPSPLKRCVTK